MITNSKSLYEHRCRQFTLRIIGGELHAHYYILTYIYEYTCTDTYQLYSFVKIVTLCSPKKRLSSVFIFFFLKSIIRRYTDYFEIMSNRLCDNLKSYSFLTSYKYISRSILFYIIMRSWHGSDRFLSSLKSIAISL